MYIDFLASTFPSRLSGLNLVVDCANGAACKLAPELFRRLGADVIPVACEPDGRNINAGVGALHTDYVAARVRESGADLGIAFDGDADRAMFISKSGRLLDGDAVLLLTARALDAAGRLPGKRVISTVMSNLGLEVALQRSGNTMARTGVGDKYVLEEMRRSGAPLGGEQSGHVIFSEYSTTGDGILTALRVLECMVASGKSADELVADLEVFPQLIVNVRIKERKPLEQFPEVQEGIAACEEAFSGAGRVLVRFSGTEPLARVMVEGNDASLVHQYAHSIAKKIEVALGA
jgi:phosphoglucosamine mutase